MRSNVEAARAAVRKAKAIAALTGAGVSAESGIPTFRSNGGLWRTNRFQDLATPEGFARDPKLVWEWYEERRRNVATKRPNAGHEALAEKERRIAEFTLITQNVDGLHDAAGSRNIVKLHGDLWTIRCTVCGKEKVSREQLTELPPFCECSGMMRPGVVWFGEQLPEGAIERATDAALKADAFIVAGTSAQVYPAAGLIPLAIRRGAVVIEVNPEETGFSDDVTYSLRGPSAEILPRLLL
ncbi:MAG TPA: NAD-dependent deacylase [Bryobacteraceae bacterium]|nr:NAD-dependent deacylase [Bryobacteraceae bacterium]